MAEDIKAFISYRSTDSVHAAALRRHLIPFTRVSEPMKPKAWYLDPWLDSEQLLAGDALGDSIESAIAEADLLICLLSARYFESEWCRREREMAETHGVRVIGVLVSQCAYQAWGFDDSIVLPPSARPVDAWPSADAAWEATVEAIRKACEARLVTRSQRAPRRGVLLGGAIVGLLGLGAIVAAGAIAPTFLGADDTPMADHARLSLVKDAAAAVGVSAGDAAALDAAAQRFEALYLAHPGLFDDPRLLSAAEALRREIRFFRDGEMPLDGTSPEDRLKLAAIAMSRACDDMLSSAEVP